MAATPEQLLALLPPHARQQLQAELERRATYDAATARELERIANRPLPEGDTLPERLQRLAIWCANHGILKPSWRRIEAWSHEDSGRLSIDLDLADFLRVTAGMAFRRTRRSGGEWVVYSAEVEGVHVTASEKVEEPAPIVEIVQPEERA